MPTERRKGEKTGGIPTDDWNDFCRTSKSVTQLLKNQGPPNHASGAFSLTVQIYNTAESIDADFPVLKISKPCFTTDDRPGVIHDGIIFDGETPDDDTTIADIVIMQGPIAADAPGSGVLVGATWCDVEVSDNTHTHAAPIPFENTKLASGTSGAKLLWKEAGTGLKRALAMLGRGDHDSTYAASLAIVTETATENGGVGKCIKLNSELHPIVDLTDPVAVIDNEIDFTCAHQYCDCPEGERIQLFTSVVKPPPPSMMAMTLGLIGLFFASLFGSPVVVGQFGHGSGDGPVTYGLLTDCVVELEQRGGWAADKSLTSGTGSLPDSIVWSGGPCP